MAGPETFDKSLWSATAPPAPETPPLDGDAKADVAIVGGGFLGLSLALHLAEKGTNVVLLEAKMPGYGASGRNTGFVVPSLKAALGPEQVHRALGTDIGDRLLRLVGGSGDLVFSLVQRHGISCDAEPNGWMQPAHTPALAALLEQRVKSLQALGQGVRFLDREATARATGMQGYLAALLDTTGGQINPLGYVRGLLRAAQKAGARVHGQSPVGGYAREGSGWRLETPRGMVRADTVFLTTNALIGPLVPAVRRSLIAVHSYQVATQPLGKEVQARILPGRQPLADMRNHTFAVRWSADNRLVSGGIAVINDAGAVKRMSGYFLRRLRRQLGSDLPALTPDYAWDGYVAVTGDFLPRLWSLGPGLYAPIGCNGRGVALTTALGRALAEYAVSRDAGMLPVPVTEPKPWPFHAVAQFGPSLWLPLSRWRDRRDEKASRAN